MLDRLPTELITLIIDFAAASPSTRKRFETLNALRRVSQGFRAASQPIRERLLFVADIAHVDAVCARPRSELERIDTILVGRNSHLGNPLSEGPRDLTPDLRLLLTACPASRHLAVQPEVPRPSFLDTDYLPDTRGIVRLNTTPDNPFRGAQVSLLYVLHEGADRDHTG